VVDDDQQMGVQEAAAIVQDARSQARRELVINAPVVYAAWGLVWLIGYGAMWLSVRGQHPYRAPSAVSVAAVVLLAVVAAATVFLVIRRAAEGIGGKTARYRSITLATWGTGYLTVLLVQGAISGSVSARTQAFVDFACPLLLAGMVYLLVSVLGRNLPAFAIGAWLVVVAACCAWLTPAAMLASCALAGGAGFFLIAFVEARLRAHAS
jgi:hypothetical protein